MATSAGERDGGRGAAAPPFVAAGVGLAVILVVATTLVVVASRDATDGSGAGPGAGASGSGASGSGAGARPPPGPGYALLDPAASGLRFRHVSGRSGRRYLPETMGGGVCVVDYDGDGWLDVYAVQSGPSLPGAVLPDDAAALPGGGRRGVLFRNRGGLAFDDVTDKAGVGFAGYGQGAIAGDIDGDGRPDLFVTAFGRHALYRNRGDGTFEDVTSRAGVGNDRWGTAAAFADVDLDGDLDLYVANYLDLATDLSNHRVCVNGGHPSYCSPDDYGGARDRLYVNRGDGTFEDAGEKAGIARDDGKGLGVVIADLNGDRLPDIYVANDAVPNFLYVNRGDGTFDEVGVVSGCALSEAGKAEAGMGVAAGDPDGDGDIDIIVTNFQNETNALYRNDGLLPASDATSPAVPLFTEVSYASGIGGPSLHRLGFGVVFTDADDDGWLDIAVANGHVFDNVALYDETATYAQERQLFLGSGRGLFREAKADLAGALLGTPRVGRGLAQGDLDRDGAPDLIAGNVDGPLDALVRRPGATGRIAVRLVARGSAPAGIGALVTVRWREPGAAAGGDGERVRAHVITAGDSYLACSPPEVTAAIGRAAEASVEVVWPRRGEKGAGTPAQTATVAAGEVVVITEGGEARRAPIAAAASFAR